MDVGVVLLARFRLKVTGINLYYLLGTRLIEKVENCSTFVPPHRNPRNKKA